MPSLPHSCQATVFVCCLPLLVLDGRTVILTAYSMSYRQQDLLLQSLQLQPVTKTSHPPVDHHIAMNWDNFLQLTRALVPEQKVEANRYFIGILNHQKSMHDKLEQEDFCWMGRDEVCTTFFLNIAQVFDACCNSSIHRSVRLQERRRQQA